MSKREERARERMRRAKRKKDTRFQEFLMKLARRKGGQDILRVGFRFPPYELGMPTEEFLSHGTELCGGTAYLFQHGKILELIPDLHDHGRVVLLLRVDMEKQYDDEGVLK